MFMFIELNLHPYIVMMIIYHTVKEADYGIIMPLFNIFHLLQGSMTDFRLDQKLLSSN